MNQRARAGWPVTALSLAQLTIANIVTVLLPSLPLLRAYRRGEVKASQRERLLLLLLLLSLLLLFDRERGRIFFKSTGARLVVHCEVLSLFTSVALSALPARSGRGEKVQISDEERKGGEEGREREREREEAESRPVRKLQFFLGRGKDSRQGRNSSFDNGCSSFFLLNFSPG